MTMTMVTIAVMVLFGALLIGKMLTEILKGQDFRTGSDNSAEKGPLAD